MGISRRMCSRWGGNLTYHWGKKEEHVVNWNLTRGESWKEGGCEGRRNELKRRVQKRHQKKTKEAGF